MKKITFFASFVFLFGAMQAQENHNWPSAYDHITQHVVGEHATPVEGVPNFDPSSTIAQSQSILLNRPNQDELLFDNGSVFNIEGPPQISVLQDVLGMSTYGANTSYPDYAMGDDFTLTSAAEITSMDFYTYQTGTPPPSIIGAYMQVWDGDPSGGGAVIWGDLTTDRFYDSMETGGYRQLESNMGDMSRELEVVTIETAGLILDAGTYWVEVSFVGLGASGPWMAPITITGETTTGDGLQRTPTGWQAWLDSGTGTAQGLAFQVYGIEGTVGIDDFHQSGLSYYPNPVKDVLTITADLEIETVKVFNILGQQVIQSSTGLKNGQLDFSALANGTYMIQVSFEGGLVETIKVVK